MKLKYTPDRLFERKHVIEHSDSVAFGCSHTFGIGVEGNETWSYLLNSKNFGQGACSSDFIVRVAPGVISDLQVKTVYVLWPDWNRFEIYQNGEYEQSLPMDKDRIFYMDTHNEDWLKQNFKTKTIQFRKWCKQQNVNLIDMTLYNLIPYIDHADRWPLSKLGHHYAPVWHKWVASIFEQLRTSNTVLELAYD